MRRRTLAILALTALGLTACSGLLESDAPPVTTWWLEPADLAAEAIDERRSLALDLAVVPGLDTEWILNLDGQARLNHYAGAEWPEHLPELLESLVARSLESAGWGPIRSSDYARDGECLLYLETRAFQGRIDGSGVTRSVSVAFAGRMDCDGQVTPLAMNREVSVNDNRLRDIVAAFQVGLDQALGDLARQMRAP